MRKIKIHNVDDLPRHSDWVKIALCPDTEYMLEEHERIKYTDEHFDFKWFQSVGQAVEYYDKTKDYPDILIADIDFRGLPADFANRELEASSTKGIEIIEYAIEYFPEKIIRYFSGQITEDNNIAIAVGKLPGNFQVIKTNKADGYKVLESKFPDLLQIIATKYIKQYTELSDRVHLRKKIFDLPKNLLLKMVVKTSIGNFYFEDIFAGWSKIKNENNFKREIANIINPNVTILASECFGVDGLKRATHDNTRYYTGVDDWYIKMTSQLNSLINELKNIIKSLVYDPGSLVLDFLERYLKNVQIFKEEVIKIGDREDTEHIKKRKEMRDDNFRYGTAPDAQSIKFGTHLLQNDKKIGGNEIEIYFPVHTLYEKEFSNLIEKCDDVKCHSFKTNEARVNPTTWDGGKQYKPTLFKEYFIFEQIGEGDYPGDIPGERLPDILKEFINKRFDLFGTLYLILRRGNSLNVYDCTYWPLYSEKDLDIFNNDKLFIKHLNERLIQKVKAFIIFEFLGWRQI